MLTLILSLLLLAQVEQPYQGIVTDAILERRMELLAERLEANQTGIIQRISDELAKRNDPRFIELFSSIRTMREEREGLLSSIREFRAEHGGLVSRLAEVRQEIKEARAEWTPFKNLIEKLQGFVWAIIGLVVACCVLFFILIAVVLRMYLWVRNMIVPKGMR